MPVLWSLATPYHRTPSREQPLDNDLVMPQMPRGPSDLPTSAHRHESVDRRRHVAVARVTPAARVRCESLIPAFDVCSVCSDAATRPAPDGISGIGLRHESGRNTLSTDWLALNELAGTNMSGLLIRW